MNGTTNNPIASNRYRGTIQYSTVYSVLIAAARYRGTVTYQELALEIGFPLEGNYMGAEIGHLLGEISEDEHSNGRPMLSAIAIGTSGYPGPGFFQFARQLGKLTGETPDSEKAFWEAERRLLYETWRKPIPS
jgi:hypothetical protein